MIFSDSVELSAQPRKTADGYLVATAKVARSGIQEYLGSELGRPELERVRVYRPESEVFNDAVMGTFAHRPMTSDHPAEPVTAENWRDLSIGQTGAEVARDGDFIRVPLVLMDAQAIKDYEAGKRELSMGYRADIEWQAGTTEDGQEYDAVQRNIRNNHLALVDSARAGKEARIGDNGGRQQPENQPRGDTMTVKVIHDGITLEVSEQAAEVIAELNKRIEEAKAAQEAAETETADAQKQLAQKDAEVEAMKDAQMTDAQMDEAVAARAELIGKAKKLADIDYSGSEAAIKKAALTALLGDSVADKSEAYIDARFDIELERAPAGESAGQKTASTECADERYRARIQDAWKGGSK